MLSISSASAWAGDITGIRILTATERDAGVATNHFFDVLVVGDGIQNVAFRDLSTNALYELTYGAGLGGWNYHDANYATLGDLLAVHSNAANLLFYFDRGPGGTFGDAVLISNYAPFPTSFFDVTSPLPGSNVPDNAVIDWTFTGQAQFSGTALVNLDSHAVEDVDYSPDTSPRSWQPGLQAGTDYGVVLGVWNVVTGTTDYLPTLYDDYFTFIGIMNDSNYVTFATDAPLSSPIPEPATMILMATGLIGGGWWARRRKK